MTGAHRLGVNAYYLADVTARRLAAGQDAVAFLDATFAAAREAGATVVRTLAGSVTDLFAAAAAREPALHALDLICARAEHAGVALLLVIANGWDDYGGTRAMVSLAGHASAKEADGRFFVSPAARAVWRALAEAILTRRSAVDGRVLSRHPAVLGFEVLNEPRARGLDRAGRALAAWLDGALAEVARHAPEALRSTGEEGLDVDLTGRDEGFWRRARAQHLFRHRQSFARHARLPAATVASVHVYPDQWGVAEPLRAEAGERFLRESAAIAAPMPLLAGELGAVGRDRLEVLARWIRTTRELGGLPLVWMLASPEAPQHRDAYAIEASELAELGHAVK